MDATFLALGDRPCAETIQINTEKAIQTAYQHSCRHCTPVVSTGMQEFADFFKGKLDELIAKVGDVDLSLKRSYKLVILPVGRIRIKFLMAERFVTLGEKLLVLLGFKGM
ncbi:hypothetical protein ID866_8720 [Astraeus odoratus]|nr:hypothetical protein ID866_8720 [Astraeus odoratus]